MSTIHCDRCGDRAEGGVTVRLITGQLPEKRPRLDLCSACYAHLERFLAPARPLADHVSDARGMDDDQADDD